MNSEEKKRQNETYGQTTPTQSTVFWVLFVSIYRKAGPPQQAVYLTSMENRAATRHSQFKY